MFPFASLRQDQLKMVQEYLLQEYISFAVMRKRNFWLFGRGIHLLLIVNGSFLLTRTLAVKLFVSTSAFLNDAVCDEVSEDSLPVK